MKCRHRDKFRNQGKKIKVLLEEKKLRRRVEGRKKGGAREKDEGNVETEKTEKSDRMKLILSIHNDFFFCYVFFLSMTGSYENIPRDENKSGFALSLRI